MSFRTQEDFCAFHSALATADQLLCAAAYYNGKALAALLAPFTRARAFYLNGGTSHEMLVPGANKLLHWEAIRLLLRKGVEKYDFVGARLSDVKGTKLEHIQRFKSRFGGRLEHGYLWKLDLNKPACHMFDILMELRRRLKREAKPRADVIDQELQKQAAQVKAACQFS
jgi:lipid II:glycine glycyltransferase (peptidoglycan interpeptide bridge formation enzyme)